LLYSHLNFHSKVIANFAAGDRPAFRRATGPAATIASRLFEMALVKNPILREYYNAETGEGLGKDRFWGFTDLYHGMLLESLLNYDASSLNKPIRPIFTTELGLKFPPTPTP
jgi:hypothetical protein